MARHRITDGVAIVVGSVALFLLVVTRMAGLVHQVEAQTAQLRDLASVDELTGLPNRRSWSNELPHAIERARREGAPLAVAVIDIDRFKEFNDESGTRPAIDCSRRRLCLAAALRGVDKLARYGGDEFIALMPGADATDALQVLERMRTATPAGQAFSAGWRYGTGRALRRADRASRPRGPGGAKRAGRDRIVLSEPDLPARVA